MKSFGYTLVALACLALAFGLLVGLVLAFAWHGITGAAVYALAVSLVLWMVLEGYGRRPLGTPDRQRRRLGP